jgi:hypothetical protein
MFKIFNENYYIDIDAIDRYVQLDVEVPDEDASDEEGESITLKEEKQIHLVKYELVKNLLETILTESNEVDEEMGLKTNEVTIPFKIAFNSLLMKQIINKL